MSVPDQPLTFRPAPPEHPWWWRLEDGAGTEVTISGELAGQRFASQADAESWVGETWSELAAQGVDAVTLFDVDREIYGPMSLHP
ncbi:hypothetical protein [Nocardioides pantholopis]|uniref:hypothetical protein n=1 Tax=Nocardioides pantholopis TaxID=2483798 RepID=UPI000F08A819|nr:hypothetical protein [Nocardioides pantholopis]